MLAPEHEWVQELTTSAQKAEIENYVAYAQTRTELDRKSDVKRVTGAFTGAYAIHPFSKEKIVRYR